MGAAAAFLWAEGVVMAQELIVPGRWQEELRVPDRWQKELSNVWPIVRPDTATVCFIGDVMMHSKQIEMAKKEGKGFDFSTYFMFLKDRLEGADLAVANMEFALGGEPYSGYPAFSAPDELAEYAAECGIDVFLAANNHIYDKGRDGAKRTIEVYRGLGERYGISYTGLSADAQDEKEVFPLIKVVRGIRIAMINFTYATNGGRRSGWPKVSYMDEEEDIRRAMEKAEDRDADLIIVLPHWGNEYELRHSSEQEETAEKLIDQGAGLIIGAHPHVVQDTVVVRTDDDRRKVQVAYSLGNAVSNMSARNTQLELMATARIVRNGKGEIEVMPLELTFLWCSRPGGFNEGYTVIPVEDFLDKRELWLNEADYINMINTYRRVKEATGIE